jgi:DNA-binding protein H-NS
MDDNNQQQKDLLKRRSSSTSSASTAAARGFVATHQSLNKLIQDLLETVKGLRREQKEQKEQIKEQQENIETLAKQMEDQKRLLHRLVQGGLLPPSDDDNNTPNKAADPDSNKTNNNYTADLAKLRRELVGMIGDALVQQEEELSAALGGNKLTCQCPCCCSHNTSKEEDKPDEKEAENNFVLATDNDNTIENKNDGMQLIRQEWDHFRDKLLPVLLAPRTFHATGTAILGRLHPPTTVITDTVNTFTTHYSTSYIDYPMKMVVSKENEEESNRRYTWTIEVVRQHLGPDHQWAVGMALLSTAAKWENTATAKPSWMLGDNKGEWAYRSDETLWSHAKQRKAPELLPTEEASKVGNATNPKVTMTLEFQPESKKIVFRGSVQGNQQPSSKSVWFEMPYSNFKKPATTSFVPAVMVPGGSFVRFLGWE